MRQPMSLPPSTAITTTRSNEADAPTIATAEWINNQIYATGIPVHEASFSQVAMQPAPLTPPPNAFPELVDQTSFAFAGQVQDICYSPEGSTTISSFQDVNSAIMHQMKSELAPLQESRQLPLQELTKKTTILFKNPGEFTMAGGKQGSETIVTSK
ncbi:hypothetical protein N7474_007178 [Penicillium riverlandense]|uniref:uncharacterized protein n=1 Tax=Penicillium riverlandense TaxID=1903569 RepID=UPI002549AEB2|nr:uncharacterized protein N7474_007178 [Penicillium riverlandense]KAJ5815401.1 hypothetical protein N7474_007178 [Penicillium riverlandense]